MRIHRQIWRRYRCAGAAAGAIRSTSPGGFSLIELMLAMTILGLGLVMVATMFPVAWRRARSMAEFTTQENVTKSAEVILQQIARADDESDNETQGSFAGTIIYHPVWPRSVLFEIEWQQRVHALYMENMTVDKNSPRRFIPDRQNARDPDSIRFAPWRLERKNFPQEELANFDEALLPNEFFKSAFGTAQIAFEQRFYPPLPRPAFDMADQRGLIVNTDSQWEDALDQRHYAWAILHRFRHEPTDPNGFTAADYKALAAAPRDLDIYYVTLRRSRPTHRYAVQDPTAENVPHPIARPAGDPLPARGVLQPQPPAALEPKNDLVLPVPWRIQVLFPKILAWANVCSGTAQPCHSDMDCAPDTCVFGAGATGVPTEIKVNWDDKIPAPFVVEMFTRGTPFIDEASGKVYRVARRRLTGENDDVAILTLDREVLTEDIDDGFRSDDPAENQADNLRIDDEERIRTVWVFPPPVESERGENDEPIFNGNQPVVGIDVRTLTVYP